VVKKKTEKKEAMEITQIIVAIIGAVAAIVVGYWQFGRQSPNRIPSRMEYVGKVIDMAGNPIVGAEVSLEVKGVPLVVYTDSQGVYRYSLSLGEEQTTARVQVRAAGYRFFERNVVLKADASQIEDIRLSRDETKMPLTTTPTDQTTGNVSANSTSEPKILLTLQEISEWQFNYSCVYAWPQNTDYVPPTQEHGTIYYYGRDTWAVFSDAGAQLEVNGIRFVLGDKVLSRPQFLFLSSGDVVIKRVVLYLDAYEPPPPISEFQLAALEGCGAGGGSVEGIHFQLIEITPNQKVYTAVSESESPTLPYYLNADESLSLLLPLSPTVAGDYTFHVVVESVDYSGQEYRTVAPAMHLRQLYIPAQDLGTLPVVLR